MVNRLKFIIILFIHINIISQKSHKGVTLEISNNFLNKNKVNLLELTIINDNDYEIIVPLMKNMLITNSSCNDCISYLYIPKVVFRKGKVEKLPYDSKSLNHIDDNINDTTLDFYYYDYREANEKFFNDYFSTVTPKITPPTMLLINNLIYLPKKSSQKIYQIFDPKEIKVCNDLGTILDCTIEYMDIDNDKNWTVEIELDLDKEKLSNLYQELINFGLVRKESVIFSGKLITNKVPLK